MNSVWRLPMLLAVGALALALLLANTAFIVPETQQAVILRMGDPIRIINAPPKKGSEQFGQTGAGLYFKLPGFERIVWIDKRILSVPLDNQSVLSTDQFRLEMDAFARFRVTDPEKMVKTAGSTSGVTEKLQQLLGSTLRNEMGKRPSAALLSPERGQVMENIQTALQQLATQYGVQIVDVRIKQANLPNGSPLDSALQRMATARQQVASTIRAEGQKQAQIIAADGDAEAAKIYADSFNKDPAFYDFYRAMQSYRTAFIGQPGDQKGSTSILLSPQNGYLRQFQGPEK